jgi:hypothetical protein
MLAYPDFSPQHGEREYNMIWFGNLQGVGDATICRGWEEDWGWELAPPNGLAAYPSH